MAKWGSADYKQLEKLRNNIAKLQRTDMEKFCRDVSKELAARLLGLVIDRTPIGVYKNHTYICVTGYQHKGHYVEGKNGGTLRRGWTAKTQSEAESGGDKVDAKAYAKNLPITKSGNQYVVEIINPVEYASYVEFGHRAPNSDWVVGHLFLTKSENDVELRISPQLIEKELQKLFNSIFDV